MKTLKVIVEIKSNLLIERYFLKPIIELDLSEGATVQDAINELFNKFPIEENEKNLLWVAFVILLNNKIIQNTSTKLKNGDVLTIIPAAAGG